MHVLMCIAISHFNRGGQLGYGVVVLFRDFCTGLFHHQIECLACYLVIELFSVEDLYFCCLIVFVKFFEIVGFCLIRGVGAVFVILYLAMKVLGSQMRLAYCPML